MFRKTLVRTFQTLRFELYAYNAHRSGMRKAKRYYGRDSLKLHLACGDVYKEGWVNIDLRPENVDLCLDLRRNLPFPDNSCDEIYSEHFLEHLWYPGDALHFLSELYRIIKPGGTVTTVVPDTVWPMQSYMEGSDSEYFRMARERYWHPRDSATMMEQLNYHFRQNGEHLFAYDEETLIHILKQARFSSIQMREFDPAMDSPSRHPGSLYAVSAKGTAHE